MTTSALSPDVERVKTRLKQDGSAESQFSLDLDGDRLEHSDN